MNVHVIVDAEAGEIVPDAATMIRSVQQMAAIPEDADIHVVVNTREAASQFKGSEVQGEQPEA